MLLPKSILGMTLQPSPEHYGALAYAREALLHMVVVGVPLGIPVLDQCLATPVLIPSRARSKIPVRLGMLRI